MIDFYVSGASIAVGRQGENAARNIYFDLSDLINIYGEGTATLVHMRPSDQAPYICETSVLDTFLVWTPSSTDTAFSGSGKCELRWVVGETLAKSIIYTTNILPSITGAGEVPSPYKSWYDAIIAYIEANYAANGAPQEVREAIYTLLSKSAYTETGLTDELAIVQAWTAETISVTNNLTHVTNSNTATMAEQGGSYTGTLTADSGYVLGTVTVTMGGEDITATVYSSGTITIPSVTGNIVITATAVAAVSSLSAVYTQSGTVYENTPLDNLKSDLVVTATYSDSTTATVPSADYTLSGTLETGTSVVTVSYGGVTTTFNVTVAAEASYITTDMIMWLDGIKNSNGGAHVSSLSTWVDQSSGGHDWYNSNFGGTINSDSIEFVGNGGTSAVTSYFAEAYETVIQEPMTVEVVLRFDSVPSTTQAIITGLNRVNGTGWAYNGDLGLKSGYILHREGSTHGCVAAQAGTHTYTFVENNGTYTSYVDGVETSNGSTTISFKAAEANIGSQSINGSHQYGFGGEICSIRFYSSALSASDIADNFAVDEARFGAGV